MDYIQELENIKAQILETKGDKAKAPQYKLMLYHKVLQDFAEKEFAHFCSEVLGEKYVEETTTPIEVDYTLLLAAKGIIDDKTTFGEIEELESKRNTRETIVTTSLDEDEITKLYKKLFGTNPPIAETVKMYVTRKKDYEINDEK